MTLTEWIETVCASTGLDPSTVDVSAVLDLARDAAHGIARPAAPLTTFMAGVLVGRMSTGSDPGAVTRTVLAEVAALVPAGDDGQ